MSGKSLASDASAMTRPRRPSSSSTHRYPRSARLNELLREVLAEELNLIDDERLLWVSITQVDVDSEMNHGTVYFDSMRGPEGDAEVDVLWAHFEGAPHAAERAEPSGCGLEVRGRPQRRTTDLTGLIRMWAAASERARTWIRSSTVRQRLIGRENGQVVGIGEQPESE